MISLIFYHYTFFTFSPSDLMPPDYMLQLALQTAGKTHTENGVEVKVIDLRTLAPLDKDTFLESVARTKGVVVVHEANRTLGIDAEISAIHWQKKPLIAWMRLLHMSPLRTSPRFLPLRHWRNSICRRWRRSSPSWSEHWRTEVRFPVGGCLASMTAPTTLKSEAQDPQGPGGLHVVQRSEGASRQELLCQQIFPCLAQASVTHVPVKGTSVPLPVFRRCGISRGSTNQNWFRVYGGSA